MWFTTAIALMLLSNFKTDNELIGCLYIISRVIIFSLACFIEYLKIKYI